MCNISEAIWEEGFAEGRARGFELMGKLAEILLVQERYDDIMELADNPSFRNRLLREYGLVK